MSNDIHYHDVLYYRQEEEIATIRCLKKEGAINEKHERNIGQHAIHGSDGILPWQRLRRQQDADELHMPDHQKVNMPVD